MSSALECPQEYSANYVTFADIENQVVKIDINSIAQDSSHNSPSSPTSTAESDNNKSADSIPSNGASAQQEQIQNKQDVQDEQICKICLEKEFEDQPTKSQTNNSEDKFISPCNCKGSIQNIHSMCFFKLLIMRCRNVDGKDIYKCEQCQQVFQLEETSEGFQSKKKKILFNFLFIFALLFSIGILVTYILILLNIFYSDSNVLCIFLVIAPFIIVILYWQLSTCLPDSIKSDKWKVTAKSEEKYIEYQIDSKNQMILVSVCSFNEQQQQQQLQQQQQSVTEVKQIQNDKSASLSKSSLSNQLLSKIQEDQL
ncbi:hypothetical protein ABPG72_005129 [Tetrahymena utriculariae]